MPFFLPFTIAMGTPMAPTFFAVMILDRMPPVPTAVCASPAPRSTSAVIFSTSGISFAPRVELGVGGIEPVDVRKDHEQVGVGKVRHHARKVVVVAELDLVNGYGIVLIDDGDHVVIEERLKRVPRVQEPGAVRKVLARQQHLRNLAAVCRKGFFICPHEA